MKFKALFLYFFAFSYFTITCFSQNIQWAKALESPYGQSDPDQSSKIEVLGKPDAYPFGKSNSKAYKFGEEGDLGTLLVSYEKPQHIQHVLILENHLPGKITDVWVYDENNKKYHIYKNKAKVINRPYRLLSIRMHRTNYKVKKVELALDRSAENNSRSQIDAIGISDNDYDHILKNDLSGQGITAIQIETSFTSEKENLGPNINSKYSEVKPIISPDGTTLYFARKYHPENMMGKKDVQDIYFSKKINGQWSKAKNMGPPLNNQFPNAISSISSDGNTLLLINHYDQWKGDSGSPASIVKRTSFGWSYPKKLVIEDFYNRNQFIDFSISSSGKFLLMAIERDDSRGDQDLYISYLKGNNRWSEPQNLGKTVNTPKAEFSPFLASDEKTLYYSSEGHGGYGGSDIFYTKRLDDTWTKWSEPQNLGSIINTEDWDAYFSIPASGEHAYFVQGKGTPNDPKNIYRIALPEQFKPEQAVQPKGKVLEENILKPVKTSLSPHGGVEVPLKKVKQASQVGDKAVGTH